MNQGWEIKKLGEICEKITDGSHNPPRGVDSSEFIMLSSKNIFDDFIHYDDPRYLTQKDFENENKRTEVKQNDVLLTIVGTIGRVAVVPIQHPKLTLQRSVAVLKINEKVLDSRFLMFSLQNIIKFLTDEARGVAQKGIYLNQLREIEIPLPPLPEQQRIVSILDECFSAIDKAKANAEHNLKNAKELFKSYLQGVFEKKGDGWEESYLGELASFSQGIQVGLEHHLSKPKEGYVRFIRIVDYTQDTDDIRYIPDPGHKYFVKEGDIVMVRYGTPGLIGRGKAGVIANNLFKITIQNEDLSNDFLCLCLSQKHIQSFLSTQGSATMPALNFGQLKGVLINFPSLDEQHTIVRQLDTLRAETQKLELIYEQKLADLEELKKSLLQKAFSGELTMKGIEV